MAVGISVRRSLAAVMESRWELAMATEVQAGRRELS